MNETALPLRAPVWEMQPTETPRAFAAFVVYRDLGPGRSLAKAADAMPHGPGVRVMKGWSPAHRWVERARAFDRHQDRIRLAARDEAVARDEYGVTHELDVYRVRQSRLASEALDNAILMAKWVGKQLGLLMVSDEPAKPGDVARMATAHTQVAAAASSAEAQAIGLKELMGLLEEQGKLAESLQPARPTTGLQSTRGEA